MDSSLFPGLTEPQLTDLLERWREPHRSWHNLDHLDDLLAFIAQASVSSEDREFLRYLALFHDAIYDPLGKSNEENSAQLAKEFFPGYPRLPELVNAILSTKSHRGTTPLENEFNGWDCAILSEKDLQKLSDYESRIAFEYRVVERSVYRRERAKFLHQAAEDYGNPALHALADQVNSSL